jgi:short-subunit dehydrogenase
MKVVITGASQGLGKCMAEHFAADGHDLILCSRNMDKLQSWQTKLMEQHGIQITSFNVDLSKEAEVKRFAELVLQATAHVDILINNAGINESLNFSATFSKIGCNIFEMCVIAVTD